MFYKKMGAGLKQHLIQRESGEMLDQKMSRLIYESWVNLPHGMKDSLKKLALNEQTASPLDNSLCSM